MSTNTSPNKPASAKLPRVIETEEQLEELLSRPTPEVVDVFRRLSGGLAIIGGGGKIGPSLTAMACRARQQAGTNLDIFVVDRFPDAASRQAVEKAGARAITCDLLDPDAVAKLPLAENVVFMVGMKFGTGGNPSITWAVNGLIPAYVARHYKASRIVAFSTGCVYPLVPKTSQGSRETDPLEPIGEYSNSCVARERVLEYLSTTLGTKMVLFRLNYAVEMRYGVLVDVAETIAAGKPVDVTMGFANVIWQGDVNAAVLRLLEHATCPPMPLNVTGMEKVSIRKTARRLARRMQKDLQIVGREARTALLSDPSKAYGLLGAPSVSTDQMIKWIARWVGGGGKLLGKPTHFQTRDGRY